MKFETTLVKIGKTTTGIEIPEEVIEGLGAGKRPPVNVTVNGYSYRSTVAVMGGSYWVGVNSEHRAKSGLEAGDEIEVVLEVDKAPREVEVPEDFAAALDAEPEARKTFEALSNSNKGWHVLQVTGAKQEETRQRRIARSVATLKEGRPR